MELIASKKKALVFGGSGLIGSNLIVHLLNDPAYNEIVSFGRRQLEVTHEKLRQVVIDFDEPATYSALVQGTDLFITLGTTMAKAGSKDAFRKVDYEYVLNTAKIGSENNVGQLFLVSSVGADPTSMFYYTRVKGEVEEAMKKLGYTAIHLFRPSVLLGAREESRSAEELVGIVSGKLHGFLGGIMPKGLKKYSPIEAKDVSLAMVHYSKQIKQGFFIHENDEMLSVLK